MTWLYVFGLQLLHAWFHLYLSSLHACKRRKKCVCFFSNFIYRIHIKPNTKGKLCVHFCCCFFTLFIRGILLKLLFVVCMKCIYLLQWTTSLLMLTGNCSELRLLACQVLKGDWSITGSVDRNWCGVTELFAEQYVVEGCHWAVFWAVCCRRCHWTVFWAVCCRGMSLSCLLGSLL